MSEFDDPQVAALARRYTPEKARRTYTRRRILATGGVAVAGLTSGLVTGDQLSGAMEHRPLPPAEAWLIRNPNSKILVHVFGGLNTPGESTHLVVGKPMSRVANCASYGYSGIRPEETLKAAMQIQAEVKPEITVVIGQSLGELMAIQLSQRLNAAGSRPNLAIFDSGCSSMRTAEPGFAAFAGVDTQTGGMFTRSAFINRWFPGYATQNLIPPRNERQPDMISEADFDRALRLTSGTPPWIARHQIGFLQRARIAPGAAQGIADRAVYITTLDPSQDAFVEPLAAHAETQVFFGTQTVELFQDPSRQLNNHTATGYIRSMTEMVANLAA